MLLTQVMVEYSQTPGHPLAGALSNPMLRYVAIGVGVLAGLYLLRNSRFSTILMLGALAAIIYYGRSWFGW